MPEVIAALVILSTGTDLLPRGRIDSLKVIEDGGVITGVVSIVSKAGRRSTEVTLSAETLGAALIRLCNAEGIPLARKSQKRLVSAGGSLALQLDLKAAQTPLSSSVSLAAVEANARAAF